MTSSNLTRSARLIKLFSLLAVIAGSFFMQSCESTVDAPVIPPKVSKPSVFILNEGSFGQSNSTLDVYNLSSQSRSENVVGLLGDVGNDVRLINNELYVTLNGSGKVLIYDPATLNFRDSISFGKSQPQQVVQISATEAVIPTAGANGLPVISLATHKITSMIALPTASNFATTMNGKLYVTAFGFVDDAVYEIDPATKQIAQTFHVVANPANIIADTVNHQLIVFSFSDYKHIALSYLNVATGASTQTQLDSSYVTAPFLANGKLVMSIDGKITAIDPVTHTQTVLLTKSYYGGAYDAVANEIYFGTGNFSGANSVDVYNATDGTLKRSFAGGIAPSHFAFYR